MSNVTEFYGAFSKDEAMQERANALKGSGEEGGKIAAEAIVAFAKGEGYSFTEEELKNFINSKELSDDDLKAVAGGNYLVIEWSGKGNPNSPKNSRGCK